MTGCPMSVALAAVVSDASSVSADTSGVNCTPTAWPLCHMTRHHRLKLLESSSTNLSGNVFPGNGCGGPLGYFFSNLLGNPKVLGRVGPHTQRETNERPSIGSRPPRPSNQDSTSGPRHQATNQCQRPRGLVSARDHWRYRSGWNCNLRIWPPDANRDQGH